MASLVLKQIEKGVVSFASSDTTKTVTLATTLSDTSKTFLLHTVKINSSTPLNFLISGRITSTTQIQFDRAGPGTVAADVEYEVCEFTSGIYVQHFEVTPTATTTNVTISSIDTSKTFAIGSARNIGSGFGANDLVKYDITSSTNLACIMDTLEANCISTVQVIQIDDATVQKISTTYGTSVTKDITVTTIDPAKTFWTFSLNSYTSFNNDEWTYLSYVNSTTLRFTKIHSPSDDYPVLVYVVSISSGLSVQNISTVIASGNATVSPSITTVTAANTALLLNGTYQTFTSVNNTSDDAGYGSMALSNLTATAFTATRAASPSLAATTNVQVLEFSTTSSSSSWFLLAYKNELYNTQNINGLR